MRFLLGNNTLSLLAGSETWTYTLALQLKKAGHTVACFSPTIGVIAEKLESAGIRCFKDLSPQGLVPFTPLLTESVEHEYDVIIANHHPIVRKLREEFPKTPIISTIHGIIHIDPDNGSQAPEHPALDSGVNQFVAVSDEVQELLHGQYHIDAKIVRNFFDVSRFSSLKAPNEKPMKFLINTNYSGREDNDVLAIREAAKHFGASVMAVGENFTHSLEITMAIKDADVVFGMGRSVLEGVAAGRLGIVLGRWGLGGPIVESTYQKLRERNFSGRYGGYEGEMIAPNLIKMIEEYYNPAVLEWGKQYIAREHNVVFAADEYVRMAEELTGRTINKPGRASGVHPDAQPLKKSYAE